MLPTQKLLKHIGHILKSLIGIQVVEVHGRSSLGKETLLEQTLQFLFQTIIQYRQDVKFRNLRNSEIYRCPLEILVFVEIFQLCYFLLLFLLIGIDRPFKIALSKNITP